MNRRNLFKALAAVVMFPVTAWAGTKKRLSLNGKRVEIRLYRFTEDGGWSCGTNLLIHPSDDPLDYMAFSDAPVIQGHYFLLPPGWTASDVHHCDCKFFDEQGREGKLADCFGSPRLEVGDGPSAVLHRMEPAA